MITLEILYNNEQYYKGVLNTISLPCSNRIVQGGVIMYNMYQVVKLAVLVTTIVGMTIEVLRKRCGGTYMTSSVIILLWTYVTSNIITLMVVCNLIIYLSRFTVNRDRVKRDDKEKRKRTTIKVYENKKEFIKTLGVIE